jgi:hypothetical protein
MDKRERIEKAGRDGRCPQCEKRLEQDRIGTGALADGTFCSIECLATFHDDYLQMRTHQPDATRPPHRAAIR